MKLWVATVQVRDTRRWRVAIKDEPVKASSEPMAVKRAMEMVRRTLPRGYRVLEVSLAMQFIHVIKPVVEEVQP